MFNDKHTIFKTYNYYLETSESSKPPHQTSKTFSTATITKKKNTFRDSDISNILPASEELSIPSETNKSKVFINKNIANMEIVDSNNENIMDQKKYENFGDVQVIAKLQEECNLLTKYFVKLIIY